MTITVKHRFNCTVPDDPDATLVRPSNWNDTHDVTGLGSAAEHDAADFANAVHTHDWADISGEPEFLTTETDPVFAASPAAFVTPTHLTNWNAAFSWGDHATAGYLTSFTETDPVFAASAAASITGADKTNWNNAFIWGNHALAGYIENVTPGGVLTPDAYDPRPLTNVVGGTAIYYVPYKHDIIKLWNGSAWVLKKFTQIPIPVGNVTPYWPVDVFAYLDVSGNVAIEQIQWGSTTSRNEAVEFFDGIECLGTDKTRLWLGCYYSVTGTSITYTPTERCIYNAYNQIELIAESSNTAAHAYTSATSRNWNGGTGMPVTVLIGRIQVVTAEYFTSSTNGRVSTSGIITLPTIGGYETTTRVNLYGAHTGVVSIFGTRTALYKEIGGALGYFYEARHRYKYLG